MRTSRFLHRLTFAGIITYIATQAHGWAGGYPTSPVATTLVWLGLSAISLYFNNVVILLAAAMGVQLGIHLGTSSSHMHHHMQLTTTQMTLAHIAAGLTAWLLLVLSERAYLLALRIVNTVASFIVRHVEVAVTLPKVLPLRIDGVRTFHTSFVAHFIEGRSPPVLI